MDKNSNRAREIIAKIQYITLATVSKEGKPWNSPVYRAVDEAYTFYWISWKENQHSKNITENSDVFLVIYDSTVPEGKGEGVYLQAKAFELGDLEEIGKALSYLFAKKVSVNEAKKFLGDNPSRVYKAVPQKVWMNTEGEIDGNYVDKRVEVKLGS